MGMEDGDWRGTYTWSVNAPPTIGPRTAHTPKDMPNNAVYIGRFPNGTRPTITIIPPWKIPADPTPATALPTMNATEDGAAPQTALPTSKSRMEKRKVYLVE